MEASPHVILYSTKYSNDALSIFTMQYEVDIYGMFIAKLVGSNDGFLLGDSANNYILGTYNFEENYLKTEKAEFQLIAGLTIFEYFQTLEEMEGFYPFPQQHRINTGSLAYLRSNIPIDKKYLAEQLQNNECFVLYFFYPYKLYDPDDHYQEQPFPNESILPGHFFEYSANRIFWESDGIRVFNSEAGIYESSKHSLPQKPESQILSPNSITAGLILFSVVLVLLSIFCINRHRKKLKPGAG